MGKVDPWPPAGVWTDHPGLTVTPSTNANQLEVSVDPDSPAGWALVRLVGPDGASAPRFLRVGDGPELGETEPNDHPDEAQLLTPPVGISGRLGKSGDVDTFAVDLAARTTLVATLDAYTLMSPVDAVLRVVDARGVPVDWNHDGGRSLDPVIRWTAPADGRYRIQVFGFAHPANSEIRFTGNDRCVYRLHVTTGPWVREVRPLGLSPDPGTALEVVGWNRDGATVSVARPQDTGPDPVAVALPGWENPVELIPGQGPERVEPEDGSAVPELPVPGAITGRIGAVGEVDRFRFEATGGERLVFRVDAARLGSSLDAWLAVETVDGKELGRNDDADGPDPRLEWTAPSDGAHVLAVGSIRRRARPGQFYRVSANRPEPRLAARLAEGMFVVRAGSTNEWKLTVDRSGGHTHAAEVGVDGLPDGLAAAAVAVPEKGGEVVLTVVATPDAGAFSGPVSIRLRSGPDDPGVPAPHFLTTTGNNNGVPQGFARLVRDRVDAPWLTVIPAPPPPEPAEPAAEPAAPAAE